MLTGPVHTLVRQNMSYDPTERLAALEGSMSLLVWGEDRPNWQRDALRRIAMSIEAPEANRDAIQVR
jgi:hypothetical protein